MANVKVAINGFGRIGRLAFRQMFGAKGYKIVAINDLTSPKMLAHLLKYDTTQGNYANSHTVTYKDAVLAEDGKTVVTPGSITVDGTEITIYACAKAQDLPWKKPPRLRLRLISTPAQRTSLFPLPRATTSRQSFTT